MHSNLGARSRAYLLGSINLEHVVSTLYRIASHHIVIYCEFKLQSTQFG